MCGVTEKSGTDSTCPAFGSARDPGVRGSSPASGSLLSRELASPSAFTCLHVLSLLLFLINKKNLLKKSKYALSIAAFEENYKATSSP